MKKKPASSPALPTVPDGGIGVLPTARAVASGPRYGLPAYQAPNAKMFGSGSVTGPPLADRTEWFCFQRLQMVAAPLVVVVRARVARVVAVGVGHACLGVRDAGRVPEHVPVQALAGPLVDAVHRHAWRRGRREQQRAGELVGRRRDQVAVARRARARDCRARGTGAASVRCRDPQQRELARMHVRVGVVGLVREVPRRSSAPSVGHRPPVDHEIRGHIGLGRDDQATARVRALLC